MVSGYTNERTVLRTRIKICGITRVEDAAAAVSSGADAIGLMFYSPSPRAVSLRRAAEIVDSLPALVQVVGVFVEPNVKEVEAVLSQVRLTLLQFHGNESPEFCNGFRIPYIKALRMSDDANPEIYAQSYPQACALLLDSYESQKYGGTGSAFLWERGMECQSSPVIIAGGIDVGNVSTAVSESGAYAVDVSTGVENSPGQKSAEKIRSFISAVRAHDQIQREHGEAY